MACPACLTAPLSAIRLAVRHFRGFVLKQAAIAPAKGAEYRGVNKYAALVERLKQLREVSEPDARPGGW